MINRERKKRKKINGEIKMEEWEEYFKTVLGGMKNRVVWDVRGRRRDGGEKEISREEILRAIRRLKEGKAMEGETGYQMKWKFGDEEEWVWRVYNGVWKRENWPGGGSSTGSEKGEERKGGRVQRGDNYVDNI